MTGKYFGLGTKGSVTPFDGIRGKMMEEFDARRAAMDLVTAFLHNNKLSAAELPALLTDVFHAVTGLEVRQPAAGRTVPAPQSAVPSGNGAVLSATEAAPAQKAIPAVSIEESISNPDFIISLITGEKLKTLKRHLRAHNLSEVEYRARYDLPADYPLVASSYSVLRRKVAEKMGLGRRPVSAAVEPGRGKRAGQNSKGSRKATSKADAVAATPSIAAAQAPAEAKPKGKKAAPTTTRRPAPAMKSKASSKHQASGATSEKPRLGKGRKMVTAAVQKSSANPSAADEGPKRARRKKLTPVFG